MLIPPPNPVIRRDLAVTWRIIASPEQGNGRSPTERPAPELESCGRQKMTKKKQTGFDFEQALEDLEALVSSMEEGELSLEDSLQAFEKGIKLTRECQTALKRAEQKVQVLINENGDTEDLEVESD